MFTPRKPPGVQAVSIQSGRCCSLFSSASVVVVWWSMSSDGSPPAHLHGRQTHSNQMGSSHPRHDCVPKDSSGVDAEMRKERPRILDRDGLTHEMDESTDTTRPHTCSECGTDRSRNAVPYLVLDRVMAVYASAARGARFESWRGGAARRADADGLGETARRTRERPWVGPTRPSTLMRRHRSHIRLRRCRRTLAGRSLA